MAREIDEIWIEEAVARYRRYEAVRARLDEAIRTATVVVKSPDNSVELLVSATGEIRKVNMLGPCDDCGGAELARSMQLAVLAAADAARWAREKLRDAFFAREFWLDDNR